MADEQKSGASEVLEKSASTAQAVRGAVKTGKAIAKIAKGAAAGGVYGAIASAVWENRKIITKILIAATVVLMLPIIYIMMLPSLIFGGLGDAYSPADPNNPIINSGTALLDSTTQIADAVDAILAEALANTVSQIQSDFDSSDANQIEVINPYATSMLFDANQLVSMYCASKGDDYASVSIDDLSQMLRSHMDLLYTYTVTEESKVVMTTDPETGEAVPLTQTDPETGEVTNVEEVWRIYRISFTGEAQFADQVFALTDEQRELAKNYASNLNLFMQDDRFAGTVNSAFARDTTIDISGYKDPSTKNNLDLVQWAIEAESRHWGYVWGTYGSVFDSDLYAYKLEQYPDEVGGYSDFIEANWLGGRTADCVGLIKGYSWLNVETLEVGYGTNGMPDIGADSMYHNATEKGTIGTIPEIPGLAVWHAGHIGIYIGDGMVIEAMGTRYGVVKTNLSDGRWTHWLKIPYITYSE